MVARAGGAKRRQRNRSFRHRRGACAFSRGGAAVYDQSCIRETAAVVDPRPPRERPLLRFSREVTR
jgi:hypothetical protein